MKKLLFILIFFILMTKVTFAEYSLKCVMEAQYKFFNREKNLKFVLHFFEI
jgi:hypothetical protein